MKNDNLDHENRPVKYGITPDELRQIQQRRIEAHAERQTMSNLNLIRAFKLGEALRESRE
jgi:hypothetical protein